MKIRDVGHRTKAAWVLAAALALPLAAHGQGKPAVDTPRYAGVITFAPDGTLFVGDNISSAVFAYRPGRMAPAHLDPKVPLPEVYSIDNRIAAIVRGKIGQIEINGMAVNPLTREVYLSVSRGVNGHVTPAIVKVSPKGEISEFNLSAEGRTEFKINDAPTPDQHFGDLAGLWPVPAAEKYHAKARTPMRSMTIVDMKFHSGELYIAGISNEEFASTLRRVPYPFSNAISETKIKIYHDAHAQWETRAPIRAMSFAMVDGKDTLVAAYTCSPLVLIPIDDLKNGAQVEGHVIGDMGNGEPLSMFNFNYKDQPAVFVTNAGHDPRVIPISSLQHAKVMKAQSGDNQKPRDTNELPDGVVGKAVMFEGSSLHTDLFNETFVVSLTRDARSGKLNLETLPTYPLPIRLDDIWSEFDFKGVPRPKPD